MEGNTRHRPQRFEVYTELKNGKGFTIPGCDFVFRFDRRGGWFDEHGNYYDKNGDPDSAPEDNSEPSDYSRSEHSDYDDDPYEKEFGGPRNYEETRHEEPQSGKNFAKVSLMLERLAAYPDTPTRVYFRNVSYMKRYAEIVGQFSSKVPGVVDIVPQKNERGQFNGNGHFIVEDLAAARGLVKLNGTQVFGREVYFEVDVVDDFLQDPLTAKESQNLKRKKAHEPRKEEKPAQRKEEKLVQKKEEAKPEKTGKVEKAGNSEDWVTYKFVKSVFPKKSSFKDWLRENKFDVERDLKQVEKIEGDEANARVTMRRKVYSALNEQQYQGNKVVFTKCE